MSFVEVFTVSLYAAPRYEILRDSLAMMTVREGEGGWICTGGSWPAIHLSDSSSQSCAPAWFGVWSLQLTSMPTDKDMRKLLKTVVTTNISRVYNEEEWQSAFESVLTSVSWSMPHLDIVL